MAVCEFCQFVSGEAEAYVLYESDRTLAFLDRNPAVEGHALVIPKDHRAELLEGTEAHRASNANGEHRDPRADAGAVFEAVQTVSDRLDEVLDPDGFSIFYTTETLVGSVEHAHVHLLPRWDDDDVSLALVRDRLDSDDAEELATAVRELE